VAQERTRLDLIHEKIVRVTDRTAQDCPVRVVLGRVGSLERREIVIADQ